MSTQQARRFNGVTGNNHGPGVLKMLFSARVEIADSGDKILFVHMMAKVTFKLHDNDKKSIEFGKNKAIEAMSEAGAQEVVQESRYAHLVGRHGWDLTRAVPWPISSDERMT